MSCLPGLAAYHSSLDCCLATGTGLSPQTHQSEPYNPVLSHAARSEQSLNPSAQWFDFVPVHRQIIAHFPMAHLNHGPAAVGTCARPAEQSHVIAFPRPVDQAVVASITPIAPITSVAPTTPIEPCVANGTVAHGAGAAAFGPLSKRDSLAARPSSTPFTFTPSSSHARPPAFPFIAFSGSSSAPPALHSMARAESHEHPHPSTFEGAQGLMLMRQSAEPLSSIPMRERLAPSNNIQSGIAPAPERVVSSPSLAAVESCQASGPVSVPTSRIESDLPPHHSNGFLAHSTTYTPSEENGGRHSDIFSVGENSDTITDPDIDPAESNVQSLSQPTKHRSFQPQQRPAAGTLLNGDQPGPNGSSKHRALLSVPMALGEEGSSPSTDGSVVEDEKRCSSPARTAPARKLYDPAAPILPVHGIQCHCRAVPDVFLNILDEKSSPDANTLAKLYGACKDDLCPLHLNAYAKLITSAIEAALATVPMISSPQEKPAKHCRPSEDRDYVIPIFTGAATAWTPAAIRRRRTSTPGIYEFEYELPSKRRRVVDELQHGRHAGGTNQFRQEPLQQSMGRSPALYQQPCSCRPAPDPEADERFRHKVLAELALDFTDKKEDDWSRGETTNRYIHAILSKCQHPNTDVRKGPVEAGFLSGAEAARVVECGTERIPIFTEGQQQFAWTDQSRPIAQLFQRMEDLAREVSVQIPSHDFDVPSYEKKSLTEIRDRFLGGRVSRDPWNILDLRSPLPSSILPGFLTGENCQLLPRIRDALLEGHSAERTKAGREDWNEWTDLLEWVLMSEGGHNTAPHMDSHGWSTWITIQEGLFGFGWLSRPTEQEQEAWMKDPLDYTGGNWRFVILKPGQTVFFPSGTVHFVFRLHAEQTLALGGHVLQWTSLERWVQVILYQLRNPNITNEDLGEAPLKYIRSARKLVENRMATCRLGSMGNMDNVMKFMALASVSPSRVTIQVVRH